MKPTQTTDPLKLKLHFLCSAFPPMGDEAYKGLVKGIKDHGYDPKNPIVIYEGQILDGAHRQTACQKLKVIPSTTKFEGTLREATEFVIAKNLHRRHLNTSQAAAVGAELVENMKLLDKQEKEDLKAQAKAAKSQGKAKPQGKAPQGRKAAMAAKVLGVSERSVDEATKLKKSDLEAFTEVKSGKKSLNAASVEVVKKKSASEKNGEAYATALNVIEGVSGGALSTAAAGRMKAKEVIELASLTHEKIKTIKPFIEAGWTLKAAMGYKAQTLSAAHTIRQLVDRAVAQGGRFTLEIGAHRIEVSPI